MTNLFDAVVKTAGRNCLQMLQMNAKKATRSKNDATDITECKSGFLFETQSEQRSLNSYEQMRQMSGISKSIQI